MKTVGLTFKPKKKNGKPKDPKPEQPKENEKPNQ